MRNIYLVFSVIQTVIFHVSTKVRIIPLYNDNSISKDTQCGYKFLKYLKYYYFCTATVHLTDLK